ncbi:MAG: site-specific DNA-methyltransferase [Pyrinomonadaceae bacterium MAG19_C2-C3]|nr:site-specific DNA-methyltransferase [Pyrinomonadaceae bacterium MAG19_C2-C3]
MSSVRGKQIKTGAKPIKPPSKVSKRAHSNHTSRKKSRSVIAKAEDLQFITALRRDTRQLNLIENSVDLIVTSPPYWRKRDYEISGQIGQEKTSAQYVEAIVEALKEWRCALRPTGSVFLNIGDTYYERNLVDLPSKILAAAQSDKWILRNRIVWVKNGGIPNPVKNRLSNRHEYIIHLAVSRHYYYDLFAYTEKFGNGSNPGDVWNVDPKRNFQDHLAPFPEEIAERVITLACPLEVCVTCGKPRNRIVRRTNNLNPNRVQARRALEIAKERGLTTAHISAIQATGISDAGKAIHFQNGTGRNSENVKRLATEAKKILGGYFREFTFPQRESKGWSNCGCHRGFAPGVVLDPFMGTGTTIKVAARLGRSAIGVDIDSKSLRGFSSIASSLFI